MKTPVSTYRIQVRESFDLDDVVRTIDYIKDLGADWVYLSPLLKAEKDSDHGYDVVDHSQVDPVRGGDEGLARAAKAAHDAGLGVLIDIVPNHVGVATPALMAWWWDVLENGRDSKYAEAFDIDWDFGAGKLRVPVLGSADDLDALKLVDGESGVELHYYDHRFPVAAGTGKVGDDPLEVHAAQNYELMDWRRADYDLNYRRFFAVNTLAAIRVELPSVFSESHEQIVRWIRDGLADGLRVDHPDGLLDPGAYLDDLAEATGGTYVLVEKILEGDEKMPTEWKTQGTTGYDALADVDRVLIDPAGEKPLTDLDTEIRGGTEQGWHDLIHTTKRSIADGILHSEVLRIDRVAAHESAAGAEAVADAIGELLTCFPVYRSYLPFGQNHLDEAAELAKKHRPELASTIDELMPVLSDPSNAAAQRFQQTSGMVMAKGVEDTAFYRYTRLTSLTEVGADPSEFAISVDEFHERAARRHADSPFSMTTLSTHDTKRGEDVRARIDAIAEIPEVWADGLRRLRKAAPLGDGPLENLIWQAVVGSYPASRDRLHAYVEKASREAGDSTTWTEPDEAFEEKMHALIDASFDDAEVKAIVDELVEALRDAGWSNSLSAKLIQLTAPGVPDVYQGSEFWEMSLVDPDNRRAVDFDERRAALKRIDAGEKPSIDETGAAKLLVTATALRLRRERSELFGGYTPLRATGEAADHVVAFDRGGAITVATRLPLGLDKAGGWGDTTVEIGRGSVRDAITGRRFEGGSLRLGDVLSDYPVALLTVDA